MFCFRMLLVVKSEYSHEVTKIDASQSVLLVDDNILDQILGRIFASYSSTRTRIFVRTSMGKYSNLIHSSFERTTNPEIKDS